MHIIIALLATGLLFAFGMLVGSFIRAGSGEYRRPESYGPDPLSVLLRAYDDREGE
jgi:hypothetical protein